MHTCRSCSSSSYRFVCIVSLQLLERALTTIHSEHFQTEEIIPDRRQIRLNVELYSLSICPIKFLTVLQTAVYQLSELITMPMECSSYDTFTYTHRYPDICTHKNSFGFSEPPSDQLYLSISSHALDAYIFILLDNSLWGNFICKVLITV